MLLQICITFSSNQIAKIRLTLCMHYDFCCEDPYSKFDESYIKFHVVGKCIVRIVTIKTPPYVAIAT